jgi:hypothetical protein
VVGITILSGVAYFWRFWRDVLRGSPKPAAEPARRDTYPGDAAVGAK